MKSPHEQILENLKGEGLSKSVMTIPILSLAGLSIKELLALSSEMGRLDSSTTRDLTTAQSIPVEIFGKGTKIMASDATDEDTEVSVIFDKPNNPEHKLKGDQEITTPFERVFVKWSAQSGKSITLTRVLLSDLFQRGDRRKLTSIDEISSIGSISGDIAGVTALPSDGTLVYADGIVTSTSTAAIIYTVPANKVLKLFAAQFGGQVAGAAVNPVGIFVRNASDVEVAFLIAHNTSPGTTNYPNYAQSFPFPIIIPAGYDVCIQGEASSKFAGCISGYIEGA